MPSDLLVGGQVSGLGTVHPLLTLGFFRTWILPLHVVSCCFNVEEEVVVIRNGWTPKKRRILFRFCLDLDFVSYNQCRNFSGAILALSTIEQGRLTKSHFSVTNQIHFEFVVCGDLIVVLDRNRNRRD